MLNFQSLGVGESTRSILLSHGITTPTPIQELSLPHVFAGKDLVAQAETGSGKTLSFALPLIERIERNADISALILVPTRELAVQISHELSKFSKWKGLTVTAVYGGVAMEPQIRKLRKTQIVVATPGRLLDLLSQGAVSLSKIGHLVLDEADRMLDMGFRPDIDKIVKYLPGKRQTLLFSATISREVLQVSRKYLSHPEKVELASNLKPEFLRQTYYQTTPDTKLPLLLHLLESERDLSIVFCNRKHIARKIAQKLTRQKIHARSLQGDMSQPQRERTTADFKQKKFNVLVATDVAARGLHIDDVSHIYNYEIPKDPESFTHRVGRTARAGRKGEAISFVTTDEERKFFKRILFSYQGKIDLKAVIADDLPKLVQTSEKVTVSKHRPRRRRRYNR